MHLSRFRPRLTVRWLMVAVAGVGLLLGGWSEVQRRRIAYLEKADWHAARAWNHGVRWGSLVGGIWWKNLKGEPVKPGDFPSRARNEWHILMAEKYRLAARHPWLPVAPDPPEPE